MTERQIAAMAISVFSVAFVASFVLLGTATGTLGDSDQTLIEHYASAGQRAQDIAGGAALLVAGASLLVFLPALRSVLRGGGLAADVFSQAGVAFAVLLLVTAGLFMATPVSIGFGGLFDDTGQFGGGHAGVLPQAATVLLLVAAYPIGGLSVGALALASRGSDVLPKWHVGLGFVCAPLMVVAIFYFPLLALPLWSCATAIALWLRAPSAR